MATSKNPNKKSLWFPDDVLPIVGNPPKGYSARVVGIVKAYDIIIREDTPCLSQQEWLFICEVLNGYELKEGSTYNLGAHIGESAIESGLNNKWDIDSLALAQRVEKMAIAVKFAIKEVAYRFWSQSGIVSDYRQKLIDCGAKIAEPKK